MNREEKQKGENFMKRIKQRWDTEFPLKKWTTQNLLDNTRRFEKESLGSGGGPNRQTQKYIEWTRYLTTEMKMKLVKINDEERHNGRGFMKRVKERWDFDFFSLYAIYTFSNKKFTVTRYLYI